MVWIIIAYLLIGGLSFTIVTFMDGYNPKKWIPTFVLTVFLWSLILLVWGVAAVFSEECEVRNVK